MIRTLSEKLGYGKAMTWLSILTFVFGVATAALGELLLPPAVAFCAALFIFEKPQKRILSYIIPVLSVVLSCVLFGWYAIISVEFLILALILSLCYRFGIKKSEASVYLTLTVFIFFIVSLYFGAAKSLGDFSIQAALQYYSDAISDFKNSFVELFMKSQSLYQGTQMQEAIIEEEALRAYLDGVVDLLVALFALAAFGISGITIKIFVKTTLKVSKHGILKSFAHFIPSSIVSYIYIVISILSIFIGSESVFSLAILNANQLLCFVFAYMGVQYAYALSSLSDRRGMFIAISIAAFMLFPSSVFQILSYLGAWFCISVNKPQSSEE